MKQISVDPMTAIIFETVARNGTGGIETLRRLVPLREKFAGIVAHTRPEFAIQMNGVKTTSEHQAAVSRMLEGGPFHEVTLDDQDVDILLDAMRGIKDWRGDMALALFCAEDRLLAAAPPELLPGKAAEETREE